MESVTSLAVLLTSLIVLVHLLRPLKQMDVSSATSVGFVIDIGESTEIEQAERTLVLALDARCRYCAEDAPYYKAIASRLGANVRKYQVVALFSNPRIEAEDFMRRHGLTFQFRHAVDFRAIRVNSTPTLIVTDRAGRIVRFWVGRIGSAQEREIALALNLS